LANAPSLNYNLEYHYNAAKPHQLEAVVDQSSGDVQQFIYNESGSIKRIQEDNQEQEFYWNEEQWLNAVRNDKGIHHYVYDDKGERIMKSSVIQSNVYVNDQIVNTIQDLEPYTLYVNPYFVITEFSNADKVSKHYYMGTQRVASELAVQTTSYSPLVSHSGSSSSASSSTESYKTQTNTGSTLNQGLESALPEESSNPWLNNLNEALSEFGEDQLTVEEAQNDLPTIESIYPDLSPTTSYKTTTTTRVIYWYHPDYIGNVDLVSDNSGEAYEFFLYSPWGESLYEWNSGTASFSSPYRFNGKELDQETGLSYYGARYYDNKISMWLSVDPLAHEFPWQSPYIAMDGNPINKIDPDGRAAISSTGDNDDILIHGSDGNTVTVKAPGEDIHVNVDFEVGESQTIDLGLEKLEDLAIGYQGTVQGTGAAGIGSNHSLIAHNVMFFNSEYGGYWYTYAGGETAVRGEAGFDASLSVNGSMFLAVSKTGNYDPQSFAGEYYTGGISPALKLGVQVNLNFQYTESNDWRVFEAGAGVGVGPSAGFGGIFGGGGRTSLLTPVKKTSERSWFDIVMNQLQFNPLSPLF